MRTDLSEQQWDAVVEGQLIAPDGTRYVRRTTKTKRQTCESLLGEGAPLVLFYRAGVSWTGSTAKTRRRSGRPCAVP
ncbi:MAG TPA: hypothetical protein VF165_12450 [Nocardioidaceae bacterium]